MKMAGGPASVNIKIGLILIATAIIAGTLWYSNQLVEELQVKERRVVHLFARGIEHVTNTSTETSDITFFFQNFIQPIDFPVILTDANDNILGYSELYIRNIEIDSSLREDQIEVFFRKKLEEMDNTNEPIPVSYISGQDTIVQQKVHFGDSILIKRLTYFPYVLFLIVFAFIMMGYVGFSQIKRTEQSNIWVGLSKETAHQLGTPVSSLMGWVELLRMNYEDKDKVLDTADEIANDIEKLQKITNRFSKIGSRGDLHSLEIFDLLENVKEYFKRRLPQTGKQVKLLLEGNRSTRAKVNSDLFEWVIENLIKNALDAIDHDHGVIRIWIEEDEKNVKIYVSDNGKGIDKKRRKDVFRPGYSTKRRGWGLGLSLSKRIVEVYHKGKISVKSSGAGEGTTFKISLQKG